MRGPRRSDALSPRQAQALALVCVEGLSHEAAAERMGVRPGTAKNHISLAYRALRLPRRGAARQKWGVRGLACYRLGVMVERKRGAERNGEGGAQR